ncbi:ABC transporter permease [Streptomyces polyrhachis]|uniref:ABC transporter permease n=1 Tax=Streptomyces polyrhachis TaxID=1282885 RepID=A0ABW2GK53_9ACTN
MLQFLIRRVLGAVVILVGITIFTFALFYVVPQDPALLMCGKNCTDSNIQRIHENLGIDQPVINQFWDYLVGLFAGRDFATTACPAPCLGVSFDTGTPVLDTIMDRFPLTLSLTFGGIFFFLIIGLGSGMIAAWYKGTLIDKFFSGLSMTLSAFQIYVLGPLIMLALVYSTGWLEKPADVPITESVSGWAMGLLIPWFVISTIFAAQYTRMSRASLIEQLQEEHIRTARAKGMSRPYVFFRYAWRGSLVPIVTILGMDLGSLLGGAIATEFTFNLHGLGKLAVGAVNKVDMPMSMGVLLFGAFFILLLNIVVDALYAFIDPRVRLS